MKVYVDPRCIITYSSYYLYGLYEYFGKSNVRFSNKFFRDVDMSHYNHRNDALMLFVIIDELGSIKKVAIDFRDGRDILLNAYYWSHVYAKIIIIKNLQLFRNLEPNYCLFRRPLL